MTTPSPPGATRFRKTYPCPAARTAAARHLQFLHEAAATSARPAPFRLPAIIGQHSTVLELERLDGAHPKPQDLPQVAAALGTLHAATHHAALHAADLDHPFPVHDWVIPQFPRGRAHVLADLPFSLRHHPVAIYKDANIRNFLLTPPAPQASAEPGGQVAQVGLVDFDDLTLAPFGYDLAKLIVSASMTHGRLPHPLVTDCLDSYNAAIEAAAELLPRHWLGCPWEHFTTYAEIHHVLTAPYRGRNGYRHDWPSVRPWPAP